MSIAKRLYEKYGRDESKVKDDNRKALDVLKSCIMTHKLVRTTGFGKEFHTLCGKILNFNQANTMIANGETEKEIRTKITCPKCISKIFM